MAKHKSSGKRGKNKKGKDPQKGRQSSARQQPDLWLLLGRRRQHLICGLILLVVGIGFMSPLVFGPSEVAGQDTVQWRAMAESVLSHKEATGEWPMWAVNPFAGMPAYMITYPHSVVQLDALVRSTWKLWGASVQFLLLLFGTYLLVYYLTKRPLGATIAAIAFGLSASIPVLITVGHNSKFVALSWAPWLLLTFIHVLRKPRLLSGLLFAIILAVALRAGHVQIVYYTAFACSIIWLVTGIASFRDKTTGNFVRASLFLALGVGLSIVMVAHPFLAQWEYKAYSMRGGAGGGISGLDWEYAMNWSQGWIEMLTLVIANAVGGSSRTGLYWGPKIFTEGPHYIGGIAVTLAAIAAVGSRKRLVWTLAGTALLFALFALGGNASFINRPMFAVFPLFDAFRAPSLWLHLVELIIAVLAGFGVARLYEQAAESDLTRQMMVVGTVLAIVVVLLAGREQVFEFSRPGEQQQIAAQIVQMSGGVAETNPQVAAQVERVTTQLHEQRSAAFRRDALRTALILALFLALLFGVHTRRISMPLVLMGLVLLGTVDLWGVGRRYFSRDVLPTRTVEEQVTEYAYDTFIQERVSEAGGPGHFRTLELAGGLTDNARPAYFYETLSGYHGAKLRVYQDYLENILVDPDTRRLTENGLDLTSVRFVVSQQGLPGTRPVFRDEETGMQVFERIDPLPRAYLVGDYTVIEDERGTWQTLRDPTFEPGETVLLKEDPVGTIAPVDSQSTADVELLSYAPENIEWRVDSDDRRILVVQDVYYPAGWNATVDGRPTPILQANHFQRAIVVPSGQTTVRMEFRPTSFRLGILLSWIATLLVYGGAFALVGIAWWKRRK